MTRIIAGAARGRRLAVPPGGGTRPTSDRAREGLFGAVGSVLPLPGTRWLDLYAGSGAVGLEALSRGAAHVLLVESDPRAAAVIRENIGRVGLAGADLKAGKVHQVLARPPAGAGYNVAFADPPYAMPDGSVTAMLELLAAGWLAPGGLAIVERATRAGELAWPSGYVSDKARRYGEATIWYGHRVDRR